MLIKQMRHWENNGVDLFAPAYKSDMVMFEHCNDGKERCYRYDLEGVTELLMAHGVINIIIQELN